MLISLFLLGVNGFYEEQLMRGCESEPTIRLRMQTWGGDISDFSRYANTCFNSYKSSSIYSYPFHDLVWNHKVIQIQETDSSWDPPASNGWMRMKFFNGPACDEHSIRFAWLFHESEFQNQNKETPCIPIYDSGSKFYITPTEVMERIWTYPDCRGSYSFERVQTRSQILNNECTAVGSDYSYKFDYIGTFNTSSASLQSPTPATENPSSVSNGPETPIVIRFPIFVVIAVSVLFILEIYLRRRRNASAGTKVTIVSTSGDPLNRI